MGSRNCTNQARRGEARRCDAGVALTAPAYDDLDGVPLPPPPNAKAKNERSDSDDSESDDDPTMPQVR